MCIVACGFVGADVSRYDMLLSMLIAASCVVLNIVVLIVFPVFVDEGYV
jgi:hypothetical protein